MDPSVEHSLIFGNVQHRQASVNTVYHCLYGFYFLGLKRAELARIYGKSKSIICRWIQFYNKEGSFCRKQRVQVYKKFGILQRQWLLDLYKVEPVLHVDEARIRFQRRFKTSISAASVVRILRTGGLTWKKIERRAIQIRRSKIIKYVDELEAIPWQLHQLVFIDEVSFDSREMLRSHGYGIKGERVIYLIFNKFNRGKN